MIETVVAMRGTVYEKGYGLIAQKAMRDKNLSPKAKTIYAYLCSFAGSGEERSAFPGVSLMMDELGFGSKDTFYKYRKELEEAGYITIERDRDSEGKFTKCIYHIEAVVTPKQNPLPKNQDMELPRPENQDTDNRDTGNQDTNNINLKSISFTMNECMSAAAQTAAALESSFTSKNEIFEALEKFLRKNCFVADNVPMGTEDIGKVYRMLSKRFKPHELNVEIIKMAAHDYYDNSADVIPGKGVVLRKPIANPTGLFHDCYKVALEYWVLQQNMK